MAVTYVILNVYKKPLPTRKTGMASSFLIHLYGINFWENLKNQRLAQSKFYLNFKFGLKMAFLKSFSIK